MQCLSLVHCINFQSWQLNQRILYLTLSSNIVLVSRHGLHLTSDFLQSLRHLHLHSSNSSCRSRKCVAKNVKKWEVTWLPLLCGHQVGIGDVGQNLLTNAHLFPEVPQHVFTAASQVGLKQDCVPLLIVHGLGDLTAQEPEEKVTNAFTLWREHRTNPEKKEGFLSASTDSFHPSILITEGSEGFWSLSQLSQAWVRIECMTFLMWCDDTKWTKILFKEKPSTI